MSNVKEADTLRRGVFNLGINPLSLSSTFLASLAVFLAVLVGFRWLTITFASLGIVIGLSGFLYFWIRGGKRSSAISATGGALSVGVLILSLLTPQILNPHWTFASSVRDLDFDKLEVVPRNKTRSAGKPLTVTDWVEASVDGIRQGDLYVQIQSVVAGPLPDKGNTQYLLVNLRLDQMKDGQEYSYERFVKGKREPKLTDDTGREYAFLTDRSRKLRNKFDRLFVVDRLLIFELPPKEQALNLVLPAAVWGRGGECRFRITEIGNEPTPDVAKQVAEIKAMLRRPSANPPDRALGRAIFAKRCHECHTLFGNGGKTGPDLTASKRNDLDFLLTSIIDPSAVIEKKYQPTIVITTTGIVYNGIVQKEDADSITLQVPNKVVIAKNDIEERRISTVSIMPTELLKDLTEDGIRSLVAYLTGTTQAPMLAIRENVSHYFPPADDLSNWRTTGLKWQVEQGVLLPPDSSDGNPSLLTSDMQFVNDFLITLRFNAGKGGRAAILIGDGNHADFSKAIRIEMAGDQPLVISGFDAKGTRLESTLKANEDAWNKLEIEYLAGRVDLKLNDKNAVTATGVEFPERRIVALEVPGGSKRNVRFRTLSLNLQGREK